MLHLWCRCSPGLQSKPHLRTEGWRKVESCHHVFSNSIPEENLGDAIGESATQLQKTTPFWTYQYHGDSHQGQQEPWCRASQSLWDMMSRLGQARPLRREDPESKALNTEMLSTVGVWFCSVQFLTMLCFLPLGIRKCVTYLILWQEPTVERFWSFRETWNSLRRLNF